MVAATGIFQPPGSAAYTSVVTRRPIAPWQSWAIAIGAVVVGCLLVASRIRPVAIVGVVVVVIALLIVSRMAIEAFGRSRR